MATKSKKNARTSSEDSTATLIVRLFDGTRKPVSKSLNVLLTINDGIQQRVFRGYKKGPQTKFALTCYGSLRDLHTVIAYADGYRQCGFSPVRVGPLETTVDLLLLPQRTVYTFDSWDEIKSTRPEIATFLRCGDSDSAVKARYEALAEKRPDVLAALLNLATAMAAISLAHGCPLDYFKTLKWDSSMAQDRFFGYADPALLSQVKTAAHASFDTEFLPWLFHPGASLSYKQNQFGEANVQLTFHEEDTKKIGGLECICVEPDIDYHKDLGAHAIFEVIPNMLTHGKTDPKSVYVLRWMAGRRAGVPEFDPPYTLVKE